MGTYLLVLFLCVESAVAAREDILCLTVLGPYPETTGTAPPDWDGGPALVSAARLAAELINNSTDVLPGYRLRLVEGDSGCNVESRTVISLARTLYDRRASTAAGCAAVVGIVGPACTGATASVGELLARDGSSLLHLSPSATSPELNVYPNTFRLVSSSKEYVNLYRDLIIKNEWSNVAAIYDSNREYFRATFFQFLDTVNVSHFFPVSKERIPLGEIYLHHRVIFAFVGGDIARCVLCMAYQQKPPLVYPVYQWIFHDRTQEQLWQDVDFSYAGKTYSCSRQQMMRATEGVILNLYRLKRVDNKTETDVGTTLSNFYLPYEQQLSWHLEEIGLTRGQFTPTAEDWAPLYYDSVWAMALALTKAETDLIAEENLTLRDYKFGSPSATSVIRRQLNMLDFEGLSGRVRFRNVTHNMGTIIDMYRVTYNASPFHIGSYGPNGLMIEPNVKFEPSSFEMVQEYVHPVATVIITVLIFLCTGFLIILHLLTIYHYDSSPIKASSPRLSQLIYSGCYLLMFFALFMTFLFSRWVVLSFEPFSHAHFLVYGLFCSCGNWLVSSGFTLILSTLVVQFWRIYNIFSKFSKNLQFLSDECLVCFVVFIFALICILQIVWITNNSPAAEFEVLDAVQSYYGSQQPVTLLKFKCTMYKTDIIYSTIMTVIIYILSLSLVSLAVLNRHIQRKEFSNSGMSVMVYIFVLATSFSTLITNYFSKHELFIGYLLWEICFILTVFSVSFFIFLPGVYKSVFPHHSQ